MKELEMKEYRLSNDDEIQITLQVNVDQFAEVATDINHFWTNSKQRLNTTDGCELKAALMIISSHLIGLMLRGYTSVGAVLELSECEGFPLELRQMIGVSSFVIPSFDSEDWQIY